MNNNRYVIAVFSVRTSTMQFNAILARNRIKSLIIETPKSASASCGISVRFDVENLGKAKELLLQGGIKNFVRFYLVENFFGNTQIRPL